MELKQSSQHVAIEITVLVKKREELEFELAMKKKRERRFLDQECHMTDKELCLEVINEVQLAIDDIGKHIRLLEMKSEEQNAKEKELNKEIAEKQKELDRSSRYLQAARKKCSLLRSKLNAERKKFDLELRQQQQPSEKIKEELKVHVDLMLHSNKLYILTNFPFDHL